MVDVIAKLEEAVSKAAVEAAAEAAAETRASGAALPALSESSDPARAAEEDYEALAQKEEGAAPSERAECTNGTGYLDRAPEVHRCCGVQTRGGQRMSSGW